MKKIITTTVFLFLFIYAAAQENILTAGFQFKPIFSSGFFDAGSKNTVQNNIDYSLKQKFGYCFGMMVRRGITKKISFETGINYIQRNYELSITDSTFKGISDFGIVGYEVPLLGMVYIQLGERVFMNTALGMSLDIFPSDIATSGDYFKNYSERKHMIQEAFLGNLGYEYRTEKSGYLYLGASYHRPLQNIYSSNIEYTGNNKSEITQIDILGNYLTLDIRYFFYEASLKQKK